MAVVEFGGFSLPFEPLRTFQKGVERVLLSREHQKLIHHGWRIAPIGIRRIVVQHTFREIDRELGLDSDDLASKLLGLAYSTDPKDLQSLRREIGQYRLANRFCD